MNHEVAKSLELVGREVKPRSSPYSFHGLKNEGLKFLREAADKTGMHAVTGVKGSQMSIVDPGHGTGAWDLECSMAKAAVVVGAAGLMIEVHQDPTAVCPDGFQSLKHETFRLHLNLVLGLSAFGRYSPMSGVKPQANS